MLIYLKIYVRITYSNYRFKFNRLNKNFVLTLKFEHLFFYQIQTQYDLNLNSFFTDCKKSP